MINNLLFYVSPWLIYSTIFLGIVASAIAFWKRRLLHNACFLLGALCLLSSMICDKLVYQSSVGLKAPADGSPLVFKPDELLFAAYVILSCVALSAFMVALVAVTLKTLKE